MGSILAGAPIEDPKEAFELLFQVDYEHLKKYYDEKASEQVKREVLNIFNDREVVLENQQSAT